MASSPTPGPGPFLQSTYLLPSNVEEAESRLGMSDCVTIPQEAGTAAGSRGPF